MEIDEKCTRPPLESNNLDRKQNDTNLDYNCVPVDHLYNDNMHLKKFHNFCLFILFLVINSSIYVFLIYFRFDLKSLPYSWTLLIFRTASTSILTILITICCILSLPDIISYLIFFYGAIDILFLIQSTSINEKFTCVLSFVYYLYYFLTLPCDDQSSRILRQACFILWNSISYFWIIVSCMSLCLFGISFIFMNLILYSTADRFFIYSLFVLSLYFYISLCSHSLRIFTYNFVFLTYNQSESKVYKSLIKTFYSLGSLCIYVFLDFFILEKKIEKGFYSIISFISSIREVSISTCTYYLFYLIGVDNYNLKDALRFSKNFKLNSNLEKVKKQINFFIILVGFVFMHFINFFYSECCLGLNFDNLRKEIFRALFRDAHSGNVFTFFILIFSVSFFFSLFMISINSSVIGLLIIYNRDDEQNKQ